MNLRWACVVVACGAFLAEGRAQEPKPARVPWTTSRVRGTPEPPHPYRLQRVFPKLTFDDPVFLVRAPGSERWFVGERRGKIFSFPKDDAVPKADEFADLRRDLKSSDASGPVRGFDACYALAFHPQFEKNRYCYVCYILSGKKGELPDGSRISRFEVTRDDPPRIDVKSEKVILTWLGGGHNGCDLQFGPDGFLYISTGDGTPPNPPDALDTGQDVSDLLSSILRIDVDRVDAGRAYAIPKDNPFVDLPRARPEIWAYGFRNPWRMSFDRTTGDLWVGDVGWELWEMVFRVVRGGNYGWSAMEGRQVVRPESRRGPTPILPPTIEFPHTEAASITGGFVYRGKKHADLRGAYVCGDWVSRKLWATKFDGDKKLWHKEIVQSEARVVSFGEDADGELFVLHYDPRGAIFSLVPNEAAREHRDTFPKKLSETGLFASAREHRLADGVVPFSPRAPQWADHAEGERFLALPGAASATLYDTFVRDEAEFWGSHLRLPADGVLGKTLSVEMRKGEPASRRRIETQLLHFDGKHWRGYTYAWNAEQSDADLVEASGRTLALDVADADAPDGKRTQSWRIPSRTECLTCHNPWSGYALAFSPHQLAARDLDGLVASGHVRPVRREENREFSVVKWPAPLVDPHDPSADLDRRARSYLHANCAHCHQFGAGGTADLEFRVEPSLLRAKLVGVKPVQGDFRLPEAKIVAPGDPLRSTLVYRMAKTGRGRMPHLGSEIVDARGLALIQAWIREMPSDVEAWKAVQKLRELDDGPALARERADAAADLARFARQAKGPGDERLAEDRKRRAAERVRDRAEPLTKLLASPGGALTLVREFDAGRLGSVVRAEAVALAEKNPDPHVRDLFERFVPAERRVQRLGVAFDEAKLLATPGDVARGRALFRASNVFQCASCHRAEGHGGLLGPDLADVGKRLTPAQILENIVSPSKTIDPKHHTHNIETKSGVLYTGILVSSDDATLVFRTVGDKEVILARRDVESVQRLAISLMPEQLLRDATAEQAADLMAYLKSLR